MCNTEIDDLIIRILDRRQTDEELQSFLLWYQASEENKQLFFQLKDIYERRKGGLYPDEQAISASWNRLCDKMKKQQATTIQPRLSKKPDRYARTVIWAIGAAVALVLIVSGILFMTEREEVRWIEVETAPRSEPYSVLLSDGSTVLLNASSKLKYPEKFEGKSREVYLDGEAFFTVAGDKRLAFIVHTDQQDIRVLGTQFNVQGYSSDPYTVTTLISGKVKLLTYNSSHHLKKEIVMLPNQQLFFDKQRNDASIFRIDPSETVAWMNGVYSFRDAPLEEITRRLGKVFGIAFIVPDESAREEKYTGKFFSNQSPEEIVGVLNFKGQFRSEFRNDTLFLLKR
ncbi:FecR family protein [Proteiniphilum sp. UBA5510]|jgi:ferric-dicitrate binding protein FerR (iron transport regulator)|uniref:FecR family protein n=1 Tax=Proteiniphilum sp. UBA5510 TaxID=1947286 RepID=UPI00257F4BB4|nr:FecR domain-containing protein [Proteiniphilum sp. UBA5510]